MTHARCFLVAWMLTTAAVPAPGESLTPLHGEKAEQLEQSVRQALTTLANLDPDQAAKLRRNLDSLPNGVPASTRYSLLQAAVDSACLLSVSINPESRVKVSGGPVAKRLTTGDWNAFLVKIHNQAGVTAPLRVFSDQSRSGDDHQLGSKRWLELAIHSRDTDPAPLGGALVEYRVIRLRTNAVGDRAALIAIDVGQGTADIGFRNDTLLTFQCYKGD